MKTRHQEWTPLPRSPKEVRLRLKLRSAAYLSCVAMGLAFALAPDGFAQTIRLEGDIWAPYVMDPRTGPNGFMLDVAETVFKRAGYSVTFTAIPWTRALLDTESGLTDGIAGIYFSQAIERGLVVPSEELGISLGCFFVKTDSTWTYTGVHSLQNVVLGTVANYDYSDINTYVAEQTAQKSKWVEELHGNEALRANLNKLLLNRVTVIIEDPIVVAYIAQMMHITDQIKRAGTLSPRNRAGIAFSTKNPKSTEYARILSEGIASLRKSGELKTILNRYSVSDWKN